MTRTAVTATQLTVKRHQIFQAVCLYPRFRSFLKSISCTSTLSLTVPSENTDSIRNIDVWLQDGSLALRVIFPLNFPPFFSGSDLWSYIDQLPLEPPPWSIFTIAKGRACAGVFEQSTSHDYFRPTRYAFVDRLTFRGKDKLKKTPLLRYSQPQKLKLENCGHFFWEVSQKVAGLNLPLGNPSFMIGWAAPPDVWQAFWSHQYETRELAEDRVNCEEKYLDFKPLDVDDDDGRMICVDLEAPYPEPKKLMRLAHKHGVGKFVLAPGIPADLEAFPSDVRDFLREEGRPVDTVGDVKLDVSEIS